MIHLTLNGNPVFDTVQGLIAFMAFKTIALMIGLMLGDLLMMLVVGKPYRHSMVMENLIITSVWLFIPMLDFPFWLTLVSALGVYGLIVALKLFVAKRAAEGMRVHRFFVWLGTPRFRLIVDKTGLKISKDFLDDELNVLVI